MASYYSGINKKSPLYNMYKKTTTLTIGELKHCILEHPQPDPRYAAMNEYSKRMDQEISNLKNTHNTTMDNLRVKHMEDIDKLKGEIHKYKEEAYKSREELNSSKKNMEIKVLRLKILELQSTIHNMSNLPPPSYESTTDESSEKNTDNKSSEKNTSRKDKTNTNGEYNTNTNRESNEKSKTKEHYDSSTRDIHIILLSGISIISARDEYMVNTCPGMITTRVLSALLAAIEWKPDHIYYIEDDYVIRIFNNYIHRWETHGYMTADGNIVKNDSLIHRCHVAGISKHNLKKMSNEMIQNLKREYTNMPY